MKQEGRMQEKMRIVFRNVKIVGEAWLLDDTCKNQRENTDKLRLFENWVLKEICGPESAKVTGS